MTTVSHPMNAYQNGTDEHEPMIDVWSIVTRHLPLVGSVLLISLVLGVLYFFTAPPVYESTADILIETRNSPAFTKDGLDRPTYEKTIETHALIIQSPLTVQRALNVIGLENLPSLSGSESPVDDVLEQLTLEVQGDDTSILRVTYHGSDPDDCEKIVSAITSEYEKSVGESSQIIERETTRLISQAKDDLLEQLREKEGRYNQFRGQAPIVWKEGRAINPHQERQAEIEKVRSLLLVERSTLKARIQNIDDAIAQGGEHREAIRFEALASLQAVPDGGGALARMSPAALAIDDQRDAQRAYLDQLTREYFDVYAHERELAREYGDGHPELLAIRARFRGLKAQMKQLADELATPAAYLSSGVDGEETDYVTVYSESLRNRLDSLNSELQALDTLFQEEQERGNDLQIYVAQDQSFRNDNQRMQNLFDSVVTQLEEINIIADHGGDTMKILDTADVGKQIAPTIIRSFGVAGLLGALAAFVLGYLYDRSERTFRNPAEILRILQLPVIGQIPKMEREGVKQGPSTFSKMSPVLATVHQHGSHVAEAYRTVRTSLYFNVEGREHRVIQITSPTPGDGKSTLAANLAVTIANSGKKVLLVDADFRRSTLDRLFGLEDVEVGLSSVVCGDCVSRKAIYDVGIENLSLMPAGRRPANPSELLTGREFQELVASLRETFDFVLIDTPPLLAVADPSAVAARVDGVLLTLRISRGSQDIALRATEILANVDAQVLGVVVNAVSPKGRYRHNNLYGSGYESDQPYGVYGEDATSSNEDNCLEQPRLTLTSADT